MDDVMVKPLLTRAQVLEILNISRKTLWRLERKGEFPKPIKLGPSAGYRWRPADIARFIGERAA